MNIDELFSALEYNHGKFPRHALERAMEEKELVTPRLLQVIRDTTENIHEVDDDSAYMLHIYALYLLAQFRETEAYLPVIEFFSTSDLLAQHITGDVVTESLGRILASTFNGDVSPLEKLIENKAINEYTRSAAIQALCILWRCEKISRQQIIEYYRYLLSEALVGEISYVWSEVVTNSSKLSADELKDEIEKAFDQGLVESFFIDQDSFNESLGLSNEEALRRCKNNGRYDLINNTVAEMEYWACFKSGRKLNSAKSKSQQNNPKTGRNDPCPCGSGKKYKKCCLLVQ